MDTQSKMMRILFASFVCLVSSLRRFVWEPQDACFQEHLQLALEKARDDKKPSGVKHMLTGGGIPSMKKLQETYKSFIAEQGDELVVPDGPLATED